MVANLASTKKNDRGVCVIKSLLRVNDHELKARSVNKAVYFHPSSTAVNTGSIQSWA